MTDTARAVSVPEQALMPSHVPEHPSENDTPKQKTDYRTDSKIGKLLIDYKATLEQIKRGAVPNNNIDIA